MSDFEDISDTPSEIEDYALLEGATQTQSDPVNQFLVIDIS